MDIAELIHQAYRDVHNDTLMALPTIDDVINGVPGY